MPFGPQTGSWYFSARVPQLPLQLAAVGNLSEASGDDDCSAAADASGFFDKAGNGGGGRRDDDGVRRFGQVGKSGEARNSQHLVGFGVHAPHRSLEAGGDQVRYGLVAVGAGAR